MMKISAAVLRDQTGPYQLEEVTLAGPNPDEVLVRIAGCGFCHTDVVPRAPDFAALLPIIPGHEGSGVIEAVGADVNDIKVGDHVVLSFDSCGACPNCRGGHPAYCATFLPRNVAGRRVDGSTGVVDTDGREVASRWFGQSSFATHAIATQRNTVVVDRSLPLETLGPLGCGIQTGAGSVLIALDVQPGSSVVVYGAGAVGLAGVMAAVIAEAETIIAVDLNESRLALARELGATATIDGADEDLLAKIQELTDGGAMYAMDTTGVPSVLRGALDGLRMTGKLGMIGIQTGDLVLDALATPGKTLLGILEGDAIPQEFIPRLIELWQAGRFPFDRLVETFPLEKVTEAERASLSGSVIKPVLLPG